MRKRAQISVAVSLVAVLGLGLLTLFRTRPIEPAYQGRTLKECLVLLDSDAAHKAQNDVAAEAVGKMGKQALPWLIHILQQRPTPKWRNWIAGQAIRLHLLPPPRGGLPLDEWQYRAARACCILGGWNDLDITPAIPALAYQATNAAAWRLEPFMWGLVYSGPQGLSVVTNLLAHATSRHVREEAARSLWITPKIRTPEVANALLLATKDADASVRVMATLSLRSLLRQKGLDRIIVPGAITGLQDSNSEVRRWTIQLVANYTGYPGVGAALSNLLNDPDPDVRSRAKDALQTPKAEVR